MTVAHPEAFFRKWLAAINSLDFEALEAMVEPDLISEYPQSGERLVGFASFRAELEMYPGGIQPDSTDVTVSKLLQDPERWVITPGYMVVPMSSPDRFTTMVRVNYPDGSRWWIITLVEASAERVRRVESYFAPELPAPLMDSIASYGRG